MIGIRLSRGRVAAHVLAGVRRCSFVALLAFAGTAQAYRPSTPDESQLQEHGHYVNYDGRVVHSPAHSRNGGVPVGATARCGDGTYSQPFEGLCASNLVTWRPVQGRRVRRNV